MLGRLQVKTVRSGIWDDKYILEAILAKIFVVLGSIFEPECLFDRQTALTESWFLFEKYTFL